MARRGSRTRAFGSPARMAHDSSPFYSRRLYEGLSKEEPIAYRETPLPPECVNRIFCKSSERMDELPDNSVHLMVTSPPYNVGKEYGGDQLVTDGRSPRLYSMTNHRVTASWKANDLEKDSVFRT
jgi:hypothetical protein